MRVINNHKRIISQPKKNVSKLFETLATSEDKIWPANNWPAMRFKDGLKIGSRGGHGPIRYTVIEFEAGNHVAFKFTNPNGFNGVHELSIQPKSESSTEIQHVIKMNTDFRASLLWIFVIRWLHDALIEEAFDNVENYFSNRMNTPKYNFWVRFLRKFYKPKALKPIITN